MEKVYKMIKGAASSSFIERKSEFIGYVSPVYTEEEAAAFIHSIKKKHYDATHNCSAYILGENSMVQRSSDDGEPSGTAGLPILEVLRKEGLTNTAIVVTRYFGGILLGAGGLIRAYTEGAASAVHAAGVVKVQPMLVYYIETEYSYLGKLQHEFPRRNYLCANTEYSEKVVLTMFILPEREQEFINDIQEWTNGSATAIHHGVQTMHVEI